MIKMGWRGDGVTPLLVITISERFRGVKERVEDIEEGHG